MADRIDWKLDSYGDLIIPIEYVSGVEAVAQMLRIRIQRVKGEWFADLDAGVDWYGVILGQRYNSEAVRSEFRKAILGTPGAANILALNVGFDRASRNLTVSYRVQVDLDGLVQEVVDSVQVAA